MLVVNLGGWFQPECYHRFAFDQFRRVVPLAIDHHRHSTGTGQCAIGRVVNSDSAGTRHGGKFWARMPLGESRFDVAIRVHEAFGTFHRDAERNGVRNIIIICHGVTLRAFVMMWRHLQYEWLDRQPNPSNCDIYHIEAGASGDDGRYVYRTSAELGGGAI